MEIITVKQCLKVIETGLPFTAVRVTYDRRRKKGGKKEEIEAIFLVKAKRPAVDGLRPPTKMEEKKLQLETSRRNPNHKKWFTRNVALAVNGVASSEIRTIHPPLFLTFNGKKVVP